MVIPAGALSDLASETHRRALTSGALQPLASTCTTVEDAGVAFQLRVLAPRAHVAKTSAPVGADAFAAPDPELVVGDLTATHFCVLNKFNVVDDHLLVVTKDFEPQLAPLSDADLAAVARCLDEIDGLAFVNGGRDAGASQPRKHLQVVKPLGPDGLRAPMERVLDDPYLPFLHTFTKVEGRDYRAALAKLRVWLPIPDGHPYNLLFTRDWMLLVPRLKETEAGVGINGLGFAGSILVRDEAHREEVVRRGPMNLLAAVGGLRPPDL